VYNSPGTIEILNVDGNQNLILNDVVVGTATFRRSNGEINGTRINSSIFYVSGEGEIVGLNEITTNGYINTTDMFLNFTEANITNITIDASNTSSLEVINSSVSEMKNNGNLTLENSQIGRFELRGNSIINSTNSTVGTLVPNMSVGEVSTIYGNLTVNDSSSITSGRIIRYYPLYIYNGNGLPLQDVNITLSSETSTTAVGYSIAMANFTSSSNTIPLYVDGLNLQNISLVDDTPLIRCGSLCYIYVLKIKGIFAEIPEEISYGTIGICYVYNQITTEFLT